MRRALLATLVLLLAGSLLLLWRSARTALQRPASAVLRTEPSTAGPAAPVLPETSAPTVSTSDAGGSAPAERRERSGASTARSERAPIRGRLVIEGSNAPLEAELAVRLRTADLREVESLTTTLDGTFTSARAYRPGVMLALVKDAAGAELTDFEGPCDPGAGEWLVPVPAVAYPTRARAHVVDRRGAPVLQARVQLVPLEAALPYSEAHSDGEGVAWLTNLARGPYRLHVQGHWGRNAPREVFLRAGPNELGELVLEEPASAGDVLVRFFPPEGERPENLDARVSLRRRAGELAQVTSSNAGKCDEWRNELRIADVPAGEYDLDIVPLDGRTYEPASLVVRPPSVIEIRARGDPRAGLRMRAHDADTGEPILLFSAWCRVGPAWEIRAASKFHGRKDGLAYLYGADAWYVGARGYRWQRGSPLGTADTLDVALEPGESELFQFDDVEGDSFGAPDSDSLRRRAPLEAVELWADGRHVSTSDADGFAVFDGHAHAWEFRKPGWRVVWERGTAPHLIRMARTR